MACDCFKRNVFHMSAGDYCSPSSSQAVASGYVVQSPCCHHTHVPTACPTSPLTPAHTHMYSSVPTHCQSCHPFVDKSHINEKCLYHAHSTFSHHEHRHIPVAASPLHISHAHTPPPPIVQQMQCKSEFPPSSFAWVCPQKPQDSTREGTQISLLPVLQPPTRNELPVTPKVVVKKLPVSLLPRREVSAQSSSTSDDGSGKTRRKVVLLTKWYFKVMTVGSSCVVILQGAKADDASGMLWHSGPVVERLSSRELATKSGTVYRLEGALDQAALTEVGISDKKMMRSFKNGFPKNWLQLIEKHAMGGKEAVSATEDVAPPPEVKSEPGEPESFISSPFISSLKRSSRGRVLKPSTFNMNPYLNLSDVYAYDMQVTQKKPKKEMKNKQSVKGKRTQPQPGEREEEGDIPWSGAAVKSLKSIVHAVPAMTPNFWEIVARRLGTGHSARECNNQYLHITTKKKVPNKKPTTSVSITSRQSMLKRKRKIRDVVFDEGYTDDIFESTPFKKRKQVQVQDLSDESFDEEGDGTGPIQTPSEAKRKLGAPSPLTPKLCSYLTTPDLKGGMKRETARKVMQQVQKAKCRRAPKQPTKTDAPRIIGKPPLAQTLRNVRTGEQLALHIFKDSDDSDESIFSDTEDIITRLH